MKAVAAYENIPSHETGSGGGISIFGSTSTTLEFIRIENCYAAQAGGGIAIATSASADLDIRWSTLTKNYSASDGGGIAMTSGDVHLNVKYSTLSFNETVGDGGGIGVFVVAASNNSPSVTIDHTTFHGNIAYGNYGGAILALENVSTGFTGSISLDVMNSTIVGNTADSFDQAAEGGGIYLQGDNVTATLANNIVAKNLSGAGALANGEQFNDISTPNSSTSSVLSNGFNFIGFSNGLAGFLPGNPNANNDYSLDGGDPALEDLGDFGGPTRTMLPKFNSPAIDKGNCTGELHDQRGYGYSGFSMRIFDIPSIVNSGNGCDIGAVEYLTGGPDTGPIADYDSDQIVDDNDNCLFESNLDQVDFDADGAGYVCDFTCASSMDVVFDFDSGDIFDLLASDSITYEGSIAGGADISFDAGQSVVLNNDAIINQGGLLTIGTTGCVP